jgi:hypothetical protein
MLSQRKKVIIVFIILILLLSLIFFISSFDSGKLFFHKIVNQNDTEKILSDRKLCEEKFVFDDGKIKWAKDYDQLSLLTAYAFCEFGIKADYKYCESGILPQDSGYVGTCRRSVLLKKVFLPLVVKDKQPQDVAGDFEYYLMTYPDSQLAKLLSGDENNSGKILNYFANKDGKICEGLDKKEACLSFFTGDAKYCQNIVFDKDRINCINEAVLRQALESQDIEKCSGLNDEDGSLSAVCRSVLNKDDQLCSKNKKYLGDFIGKYCEITNPLTF